MQIRHRPLIVSLCAFVFALLLGFGGVYYTLSVLPAQTYAQLDSGALAALNPHVRPFPDALAFNKAENRLQELLQSSLKGDPKAYLLLGTVLESRGDSQNALLAYDRGLQAAESNWLKRVSHQFVIDDLRAAKAILYYQAGEKNRAQRELQAIQAYNGHAQAELLTAMAQSLEAPERADYHFELARQLHHDLRLESTDAELAAALELSQDPETRAEIRNFRLARMPRNLASLTPLGRYYSLAARDYQDAGQLEAAAAYYQKAIAAAPGFEWAYQNAALTYQGLKQSERAFYYLSKALAINPDFYLSHITWGDLALGEADYQGARAHFLAARQSLAQFQDRAHLPFLVNVENQLGFTSELLENGLEARRHYQQALTLAQDNETLVNGADYEYTLASLRRVETWLANRPAEQQKQFIATK